MRETLIVGALALTAALPAAASAAPTAPAEVTVTLGPSLAAQSEVYGARELAEEAEDLRRTVAGRAGRGGFTRLDLVLEDAVPNRPTPAMLGRNVNFDFRSLSRGGAAISGTAYGPGGARPVRFSWWSYDLQDSAGAGIWTDADRAYQLLASELAHGRAPEDRRAGGGGEVSGWPRDGSRIGNPGLQR